MLADLHLFLITIQPAYKLTVHIKYCHCCCQLYCLHCKINYKANMYMFICLYVYTYVYVHPLANTWKKKLLRVFGFNGYSYSYGLFSSNATVHACTHIHTFIQTNVNVHADNFMQLDSIHAFIANLIEKCSRAYATVAAALSGICSMICDQTYCYHS